MLDKFQIEKYLQDIPSVENVKYVSNINGRLFFNISVIVPGILQPLKFTIVLDPWYPAKTKGVESIHFYNKDLIAYPHIMEDGRLCLHTISSPDWKTKLKSDIGQLCQWIKEYYIGGKKDSHYEHLVVNESLMDDCYHTFCYSQPTPAFHGGEFGLVNYRQALSGQRNGKVVRNFIVSGFVDTSIANPLCHKTSFSAIYSNSSDDCPYAPFIALKRIPARYNKFVLENYSELSEYATQEQAKHVYRVAQEPNKKRTKGNRWSPLFIGYPIPNGEFHWVVSIIENDSSPTKGIPEKLNGIKTGKWISVFNDEPIKWAKTLDISPEHFFGRGAFSNEFCKKRILIMGIGAIGSMVAQTLVRCGCVDITLYDYDIKYPENICRSEYTFLQPVNNKVDDLTMQLLHISPYVNINRYNEDFDIAIKWKATSENQEIVASLVKHFNESYDLIIDCTTDDDVMFVLEQLNLSVDIVNLSITNHARELVCAFSPSIYSFVKGLFENLSKKDDSDYFCPTGCWNPTFKASYNEIATKVQYAIKRMVRMLSKDERKQNFVLSEEEAGLKFTPW